MVQRGQPCQRRDGRIHWAGLCGESFAEGGRVPASARKDHKGSPREFPVSGESCSRALCKSREAHTGAVEVVTAFPLCQDMSDFNT